MGLFLPEVSIRSAHAPGLFAKAVLFPQFPDSGVGGCTRTEDAEDRRARACHHRTESAVVEKAALDFPHSAHAPVVHILKDVVHPAADAAEVTGSQRLNDPGGVRVAAGGTLVKLPEQLRRGDGEIRLADDKIKSFKFSLNSIPFAFKSLFILFISSCMKLHSIVCNILSWIIWTSLRA